MDEDGIGLVLARASDLRSKITTSIHRASTSSHAERKNRQQREKEDKDNGSHSQEEGEPEAEAEAEEEEDAESLLNIRDALESLEAQLSSLQALQQQHWYEREAALAEIDHSRTMLLMKLKEYKGEELEVIHEAIAFASEAVEENNDLLLPPYPSRPSCSIISDNGYLSHFSSRDKFAQNGITNGVTTETKKTLQESERKQSEPGSESPPKGLRVFINAAARTVITVLGVISIMGLAGFEPRFRKRDTRFKVFGLFQQRGTEAERKMVQCPPGKVLVMEGGEARCLVKERVEIPFDSVVAKPDVNYGCG